MTRDKTARLAIRTILAATELEPAAVLGVLGGAAVGIVIGEETGTSLPRSIESVSGIEPTPF